MNNPIAPITPAPQPLALQSFSGLPQELLSKTLSLTQLLAMLRAHLKTIAIAALAAMVLALLVTKLVLKKTYFAAATVMVDYGVNSPESTREFSPMLATSYMTTQLDLINSSKVLGLVVDQAGLERDPKLVKGYSGPASGFKDWVIDKKLRNNLTISNGRESRLISIGFSAGSADEAASVANAVAETYVKVQAEQAQGPAKSRAEEYLKSLDALRQRQETAQLALAAFRKRTGLVDFDGKGLFAEQRLSNLSNALLTAEADSRDAKVREQQVARLSQNPNDADVESVASTAIVNLKEQLLASEQRFIAIQKDLGPSHPDYIAAQKEVSTLRAQLQSEVGGYSHGVVNNARTRAGVSGGMVASLRKELVSGQEELLKTRELQDESARLTSELEAASKIYSLSLDHYGEIIRSAETRFSNISIVSAATPPVRHNRPSTVSNLLLGLFGGAISAGLFCLLMELRHRRVRCVEDFELEFGEAPLVVIGHRRS